MNTKRGGDPERFRPVVYFGVEDVTDLQVEAVRPVASSQTRSSRRLLEAPSLSVA